MKTGICSWCHPHSPKYMAQRVVKHAASHGICSWHRKLWLFKAGIREIQVPSAAIASADSMSPLFNAAS